MVNNSQIQIMSTVISRTFKMFEKHLLQTIPSKCYTWPVFTK